MVRNSIHASQGQVTHLNHPHAQKINYLKIFQEKIAFFSPQKYLWMQMAILSEYCLMVPRNNLAVAISKLRKIFLSLLKNFLLEVSCNFKDYFVLDGKIQMQENKIFNMTTSSRQGLHFFFPLISFKAGVE